MSAEGELTVLGKDIKFQGKLHLKDSLTINGTFRGYIQTPGHLEIGPSAVVEADIDASEVRIDGYVQGNVFASKKIELHKNATLHGDLRTSDLQIASGSRFRGACVMD